MDPEADVAGDVDEDSLRQRIQASDAPIFVAVLPAAAIDEGGGDAGRLPSALATRTGLTGTYGVVAGRSFRGEATAWLPDRGERWPRPPSRPTVTTVSRRSWRTSSSG